MTSTAPPSPAALARSRVFLAAFCTHCGWHVDVCPCCTRLDATSRRRLRHQVAARHRDALVRALLAGERPAVAA